MRAKWLIHHLLSGVRFLTTASSENSAAAAWASSTKQKTPGFIASWR